MIRALAEIFVFLFGDTNCENPLHHGKETVRIYVEEYDSPKRLSARLRDKKTGRIVVLDNAEPEQKAHFLWFLSMTKIYSSITPSIFNWNGDDIIVANGIVTGTDPGKIRIETSTSEY